MTASEPRKHHFIPVFYLKEFTRTKTPDGNIVVTDLERRKQWSTTARKAGFMTDYYKVGDEFGADPYIIEKELSRVESLIAPYYRDIISKRDIPTPDHLAVILRFVALLAIRTPGIRTTLLKASEHQFRGIFQQIASSEAKYSEAIRLLQEDGYGPDVLPPREELLSKLPEASIKIEPDQSEMLKTILPIVDYIEGLLRQRRWSLVVIDNPTVSFVTSDTPLYVPARLQPKPGVLLQFELPYREIYVPLSSHVALVSRDAPPGILTANQEGIAIINNQAMWGARFIFSSETDYLLYKHDKTVGSAREMLSGA